MSSFGSRLKIVLFPMCDDRENLRTPLEITNLHYNCDSFPIAILQLRCSTNVAHMSLNVLSSSTAPGVGILLTLTDPSYRYFVHLCVAVSSRPIIDRREYGKAFAYSNSLGPSITKFNLSLRFNNWIKNFP